MESPQWGQLCVCVCVCVCVHVSLVPRSSTRTQAFNPRVEGLGTRLVCVCAWRWYSLWLTVGVEGYAHELNCWRARVELGTEPQLQVEHSSCGGYNICPVTQCSVQGAGLDREGEITAHLTFPLCSGQPVQSGFPTEQVHLAGGPRTHALSGTQESGARAYVSQEQGKAYLQRKSLQIDQIPPEQKIRSRMHHRTANCVYYEYNFLFP